MDKGTLMASGAAVAAAGAGVYAYQTDSKVTAEVKEIKKLLTDATPQLQNLMSKTEHQSFMTMVNRDLQVIKARLDNVEKINKTIKVKYREQQEYLEQLVEALKAGGLKLEVTKTKKKPKKKVEFSESESSSNESSDSEEEDDEPRKKSHKGKGKKKKGPKPLTDTDISSMGR
jgi:hypothetical protein